MENITTIAPTATPTATPPPFGLLHIDWDESNGQQMMYDYKVNCANAIVVALATVLTQYVVTQWVWASRSNTDHRSPVYLVSGITFVLLWSFLLNNWAGYYDPLPIGYRIATPILATVGGVLLNLLFCCAWNRAFNNTAEQQHQQHDETREVVTTTAAVSTGKDGSIVRELEQGQQKEQAPSSPATTTNGKKQTLHFINNIKIVLTCLVMVNHVGVLFPQYVYNTGSMYSNWGGIFVGFFAEWPGAWFMHLFFFYSGYFAPKSLDKKGPYMFLFERIKRLGIPLIVLGYLVYPFSDGGGYLFAGHQSDNFDLFSCSVAWFLLHLIFFNVAYAYICGVGWNPKIPCPSLFALFGLNVLLGVIAGITSWFFPLFGTLLEVPMFWKMYLGYAIFFFGGALATRNNWVESIKAKSRLAIYLWAVLALVVYGLSYWWSISWALNPDQVHSNFWRLLYSFVFWFAYVQQAIPMGLAVTVFFADFVNGKCPDFFSKSMYTAYLIQLILPVPAAIKCWELIANASGLLDNAGTGETATGGIVVAGFLFSFALSQLIGWPLAYAIRSIPGFSQVL